jgi:hypothetical protein
MRLKMHYLKETDISEGRTLMAFHKSLRTVAFCIISSTILWGCATFNPRPIEEVPFQKRAQTQYENNVRVTAAVLSAEESQAVFGLPLYSEGIQPIWLEIENNDEERVWFLPVGVDPDYFAPLEVAYMHHFTFSKRANEQIDKYFYEQAMKRAIPPGSVRSGFVFTNLDMGTKAFNVDLLGEDDQVRTFTFFISVPGFKVSHQDVHWQNLYLEDEIASYDEEEDLRKALESLPCCTTNQEGTNKGDPVNVVFIGKGVDLHYALIRAGWDETEAIKSTSRPETGISLLLARHSRYAPVSPLYLYGRPQDAAFRKSRETADERNHLRLWVSPMRLEDKPVWVGQISRLIKVRYLPNMFQIEPLVDEARTYILQNLWYSQALAKYGYVSGVGAVSMSEPRTNLDGDPYFTDGYRVVMWVSSRPISFSEVEVLHWEIPRKSAKEY